MSRFLGAAADRRLCSPPSPRWKHGARLLSANREALEAAACSGFFQPATDYADWRGARTSGLPFREAHPRSRVPRPPWPRRAASILPDLSPRVRCLCLNPGITADSARPCWGVHNLALAPTSYGGTAPSRSAAQSHAGKEQFALTTLRILAATLALALLAACGADGDPRTPGKRGLPRASRWAEASASAYRAHSKGAPPAPRHDPR